MLTDSFEKEIWLYTDMCIIKFMNGVFFQSQIFPPTMTIIYFCKCQIIIYTLTKVHIKLYCLYCEVWKFNNLKKINHIYLVVKLGQFTMALAIKLKIERVICQKFIGSLQQIPDKYLTFYY